MSYRTNLSMQDAERIWFLHCKGLKTAEISKIERRSVQSVRRVVDIFERTKNGTLLDVELQYGDKCQNIRKFAIEFFGIAPYYEVPAQTSAEKDQQPAPGADNTQTYLESVLQELHRTNELLARLCEVWGAEC